MSYPQVNYYYNTSIFNVTFYVFDNSTIYSHITSIIANYTSDTNNDTIDLNVTINPSSNNKTISFENSSLYLIDETYSINILINDSFGNLKYFNRTFTIDTTNPTFNSISQVSNRTTITKSVSGNIIDENFNQTTTTFYSFLKMI